MNSDMGEIIAHKKFGVGEEENIRPSILLASGDPSDVIATELTHGQDHRYKLRVPEIPPEFSDVSLSTSSFSLNFILIIFYLKRL